MEIKVQKWGNSLAIRIPKSYAKDIDITQGSVINISKDKDTILLKPKKKKEKLQELLSKIEEVDIHEEIDFGDSAGSEIW